MNTKGGAEEFPDPRLGSPAQLALSIKCPQCGVAPGRACTRGLYVYWPRLRSHPGRYRQSREVAA